MDREYQRRIINELKKDKIDYPPKYKQGFDDSNIWNVYKNYRNIINKIDKENINVRKRTKKK